MRWLLISSQNCASHGGIGAYVERFLSCAKKHGWSVELITRAGAAHLPANVLHEIETLDMLPEFDRRIDVLRRIERIRPYRYALWSKAVADKLLTIQRQFDAIEFVDCQAEGFTALGNSIVRQRYAGTPMIVHAHTPMSLEEDLNGADLSRFGRAIYHQWERDALRCANGVMVTSQLIADRLQLKTPILVNPYPIDDEVKCSTQPRTREILLIGSIQPRKGVIEWARSLNEVFRRCPDVTGVLIGPDTPTSPSATSMAAHVQSVIQPEFRDRFAWCGSLPHRQVMERIRRAACVIVPSTFESFSFAAAEALCCGTPVIVSDQVGIREHVNGLATFRRGEIAAMVEAQLEVLNDPEQAACRTLECKKQLLQNCSPKLHLQKREAFVEAIKSTISERCSPASTDEDSLAVVDRFIKSVENAEVDALAASSVRS